MKYTTINILGNLISEEILQKIEKAEADGQLAKDFGLEPGANLRSEIEYAWSRIKLDWKHFSDRSQKLPSNDPYGTTLSRKWMEQFLNSLGFETLRQRSALQGSNNQQYAISHTAENLDGLPLHIVGFLEPGNPDKNTLDVKSSGGTSRFSPHATMQEYLNVTEHVYGIASNGLYLRLLRDSGRLIKLSYLEFDLKRMLDEDRYSEFTLLYRLLHASRFPRSKGETEQCYLDKYYQDSIETGNRIRDGLSLAVKESLVALGKGFLQHEENEMLRNKIKSGQLSPKDYYRQLLRIIYRLLFLMVTEERDLIYDPEDQAETTQKFKKWYWKFYSISRLRKMSENRYLYEERFTDLWDGLVQTFKLFEAQGTGKKMGIQPLDGDLFSVHAIEDLQYSTINNQLLLECIRNLNEFEDKQSRTLVSINYRSLDVEELGSVYEGLLELHPVIENMQTGSLPSYINFTFHEGTDRKTTGSYYTRPELVNELIKSALIPVIEERLKEHSANKDAQAKALLRLKVCDAAAGSGHMLLAAARTIAWYLARVQSGEDNPAATIYRKCLREVIQHCIYAVDYNPDAVELCKLALWLEGHNSGKPLSFLDHKIRNGNSLVGVTELAVLEKPIPDEAYTPVTGDDKEVCKELKKRNAAYRKTKQIDLFSAQGQQIEKDKAELKKSYSEMEGIEQDSVEAVQEVKKRYDSVRKSVYHEEKACHIWTAAFFKTYNDIEDPTNPTSERLGQYFFAPTQYGRLVGEATILAEKHKFFHWPLEFPDVFEQGGFDVMLGNPPWERIKLQEKEYYATRDRSISLASNKAEREKLIKELPLNNPVLYEEFRMALHSADCVSKFLRNSNRFILSAKGDVNTYAIFTELFVKLINQMGSSGLIVPIGIATDSSTKDLFSAIVEAEQLRSLIGFENEEFIFQEVHHSTKFCCLTITGRNKTNSSIKLSFYHRNFNSLQDDIRFFNLSKDDFRRINPNTKTCPIFRTKFDSEIVSKIYGTIPILINEEQGVNEWGIDFGSMFHMANDSHLFIKLNIIEAKTKPCPITNGNVKLRLYEAKMISHFDHRFASYEKAEQANLNSGILPQTSSDEKGDAAFFILPKYFVDSKEVDKLDGFKNSNWFLGFREITSSISVRTAVFSLIPYSAIGNKIPLIQFNSNKALKSLLIQANFNSLTLDYVLRQKLGGISLSFFYIKQLPIIKLSGYPESFKHRIFVISLELCYSSWDIKPFADDAWNDADEKLKAVIQQNWQANKDVTGGHDWNPPDWCEIDPDGCPLPPFKWDEERRAVLKAELDAIYARLYGLTTEELRYILDPQDVYGPDFPGETFRVLKEKEIKQYGEYRTRRLVLEAWERLNSPEKRSTFVPEPAAIQPISVNLNDTLTAMKEWSLHDGIYSIQDCARITRLSADKIRRWFGELYKEKYEGFGDQRKAEVSKLRISFHGLIELVVIGTLRENRFTLKTILAARKDLKSKTSKEYPFATNNVRDNLKVSGSDIVFQFPQGLVTLNGTGQINLDFIKTFFKGIHFNMEGIADSLMPEKGKGKITINPKEANGKPAIVKKEVPVDTILQFYTDTSSIKRIQEQFNLEEDEVLAAIEYSN